MAKVDALVKMFLRIILGGDDKYFVLYSALEFKKHFCKSCYYTQQVNSQC